MEQDKKISIIVPAYNVEKYIPQCLDSLINQTYKNIEIIVINDGSTDDTLKILRDYEKKDNRIVLITQQNQGVSASRNNGLKKVTGDFIIFVDSDDWLELNTCELMINTINSYNADIAMFGYIREYKEKSLNKAMFEEDFLVFKENEIKNKLHRRIFGPIEDETKHPEKLNAITTIWSKIYKTEIIKNTEFLSLEELGLCEDGYFNISAFEKANIVVFKKEFLYHYRKIIDGKSLTQKYVDSIFKREFKFYYKLKEYIERHDLNNKYMEALNNRMTISLIEYGISIVNYKENVFKNINRFLKQDEYANACKNFKTAYMPIHWKTFFWLAKCQCTIGVILLLKIIVKLSSRK